MKPFSYERASGIAAACASAAEPTAKFIAGGTNLIDLMKLQIETPARLVDIGRYMARPTRLVLSQQRNCGANLARRAVAALQSIVAHKCGLHRMKIALLRQPLDGGDLVA